MSRLTTGFYLGVYSADHPMEIFLLLLDELDDATATARVLLPRALGFLLACGAFVLSVVAAIHWSNVALVILLSTLIVGILPTLRLKPFLRLETDP